MPDVQTPRLFEALREARLPVAEDLPDVTAGAPASTPDAPAGGGRMGSMRTPAAPGPGAAGSSAAPVSA